MPKRMYGVEMDNPAGKLPGFYAQVIHKIGDAVNVFDRDQQLFIVESEEERQKLMQILKERNMLGDVFDLWLLPEGNANVEDCGFVSLSGHAYLYDTHVAFFRFAPQTGTAQDRWAALQQMEEYLVTHLTTADGESLYVVGRSQMDLMEGIARAYKVEINWVHS
ncbi:MAG: hypothetical protein H0Z34_00745 [Brevibacillus sp.]|nr:hypothetical protein [Brevibacillus sp.]